jgi:hypothetical protein
MLAPTWRPTAPAGRIARYSYRPRAIVRSAATGPALCHEGVRRLRCSARDRNGDSGDADVRNVSVMVGGGALP